MSIKTRLSIVLCVLLAAFLATLLALRRAERSQVERVVGEAKEDEVRQLDHWLNIVDLPLHQFVSDYANWSDTAEALAQPDSEQIRRHLTNNLPAYGLDAVWLLQADGVPVFSEFKDPRAAPPPPPALLELTTALQRHETIFFAENSNGLWQYCVSTVASAAGSAPDVMRGWLVAARRWDDDQLGHLSRLTESRVRLVSAVEATTPEAPNSEILVMDRPLNDVRGRAIRRLRIEQETADFSLMTEWEGYATNLFVVFGLVLLAILALCVRLWVLQPLQRIGESLSRQNVADIEPLLARSDEFTRIARLVETSFADRRALEREVVERKQTEAALYHSIELRARLARDLHDTVIQSIYAAGLGLESVRAQMSADPFGAEGRVRHCMQSLNDTIRQVRSYITDLEPDPAQQRQSFPEAVRALASTMQALSPVEVSLHIDESAASHLSLSSEVHALQIVRESISNAMRHGGATRIDITLRREPLELVLEVGDNGHGFNPAQTPTQEGHGLRNLQTRAAEMGGTLRVDSVEGHGATVTLRLPLSETVTK